MFNCRDSIGGIPNGLDAQLLQKGTKVHKYVRLIIDDKCSDRPRHCLNLEMPCLLLQVWVAANYPAYSAGRIYLRRYSFSGIEIRIG